jgi:phage terminase large subunit
MSDLLLPANNWTPYKFQGKAWNAMVQPDFRRAYLCWPRRHGKDSAALHITAIKAMQRVGNYAIMLPQINQVRRALWDGLSHMGMPRVDEAFPDGIVRKKDSQSMQLWLESGSTVQFLGSDSYESSIGSGFTGIVYSEAALTTMEASQFLRPMIEFNKGYEIFISTPRGRNHFWRGLNGAMDDMRSGLPGVFGQRITAHEAGLFTKEDLERIKRDYIRDMGQVMGLATFSQEYEVSFEAALVGAVWGAELEELQLEGRVRSCPHDRRFPVYTTADLGVADPSVFLFYQEINGQYRLIDGFQHTGIGMDTYIKILKQYHHEKGYNYATHFAPHDIQQREFVRGLSRLEEARRLGLVFTRTPQTRLKTQIAVGAQLIRQMVVNSDSPGALEAFEHFKGYRFPANKSTGQLMETPLHDEHSHASSALMTYAINIASKLGMGGAFRDGALHGEDTGLGGTAKFDPRQFGRAPYQTDSSVSSIMRAHTGGQPTRGAFG